MSTEIVRTLRRRGGALLLAAAAVLPVPVAAQQASFPRLPWSTPADSVLPRLEADGWRLLHANAEGDLWLGSDDASLLVATRGGRLVEVQVEYPAPTGVEARYRAITDSLRARFGEPTFADAGGNAVWERGIASVRATLERGRGDEPPHVQLAYLGPGWIGVEIARLRLTDPFPSLEERWVVLRLYPEHRISLDTVAIGTQGPGTYRARLRIDFRSVQPDPSGRYDALIYGWDYDCRSRRVQMRSRTALLAGRQVRSDSGVTVWSPAPPNSQNGIQLDIVCGYVAARAPA
jgi:hypothetical protein